MAGGAAPPRDTTALDVKLVSIFSQATQFTHLVGVLAAEFGVLEGASVLNRSSLYYTISQLY